MWRLRYKVVGRNGLTAAVYGLAGVRILLCMMPQNQWLSADAPLSWGICRNIPFALLGLLVIVLFFDSARKHGDKAFRWMWLTIVLSFGFYIPVAVSYTHLLFSWTGVARIVRAQTLTLKERDFVIAAKTLGVSHVKIILKHIIPNMTTQIIVAASLSIAGAILDESALSRCV